MKRTSRMSQQAGGKRAVGTLAKPVQLSAAAHDRFDPLVHWAARFAKRRALKRMLLGQTTVAREWSYWRQARHLPDGRPGSLLPPPGFRKDVTPLIRTPGGLRT